MKTNIDYWMGVLNQAPESYKKWFAREREYLEESITSNSEVLEVGCGDGRSIFDLMQKTKNIVGIDHDEKAILNASKIFDSEPSIIIIKADAADLPFSDGVFDFVICMTTFANFADQKYIVLEEMKRVLKNDGKIIISVFSENALEERMKIYTNLGIKIRKVEKGKVTFDESVGDNISEQFSELELREIFSQATLKINDITKVDIAYLCTVSK